MAIANRERGELPLVGASDSYVMKFTTNAICQIETVAGKTLEDVIAGMQRGSLVDVRWFLWAMLQAHHPDFTVEQAGDAIDDCGGLGAVMPQVQALIELNTREAANRKGRRGVNPPRARAIGTGDASTSTPGAAA